jgi:uncharacterized iron-regulated protein
MYYGEQQSTKDPISGEEKTLVLPYYKIILLEMKFQLLPERRHAKRHNQDGKKSNKVKETLVLTSSRSGAIIGSFDILVDIGVPAEKEVIQ